MDLNKIANTFIKHLPDLILLIVIFSNIYVDMITSCDNANYEILDDFVRNPSLLFIALIIKLIWSVFKIIFVGIIANFLLSIIPGIKINTDVLLHVIITYFLVHNMYVLMFFDKSSC